MRQLVELIGTNAARISNGHVPVQVFARRAEEGYATAREGDLRRRGPNPETVRVAGVFRAPQHIDDFREFISRGVHGIGVIPHDAEIRGSRFHRRELFDAFLARRHPRRVSEHWHGPHALRRRIFSQLSDSIYVWPIFEHWHGDIFKAELLRDGVVAVVAWHRADPLALLISHP